MGIVGNPKSIVTDGLIFHVDTGNISSYDHDQSQLYVYSIRPNISQGLTVHQGDFGADAAVNMTGYGYGSVRYMEFDGTDDKLRFTTGAIMARLGASSGTDNNVAYSQEAWFWIAANPTGVGTSGYSIAGTAGSGGIGMQVFRYLNENRLNIGYRGNSNSYSNYDIPLRKWVHAVYTRNFGGGCRIYINGELDNNISSGNLAVDSTTDDFEIGHAETRIGSMNGRILSTSIYNRALSDAEVKQNFQSQRYRFENVSNIVENEVSWV